MAMVGRGPPYVLWWDISDIGRVGLSPPLFDPFHRTLADGDGGPRPTLRSEWADTTARGWLTPLFFDRTHSGAMPNYRRIRVPGGTYSFTVAIAERQTTVLVDHVDALRNAFQVVRKARPFRLDAIVVLPDHLHCMWTLPPGDTAFPVRWSQIKATFSRSIPAGESRLSSRIAKRERGLWQRRYWEHLVRDEGDFQRCLDYIHYNPIKHGHVARAMDWPHSSFRQWVDRGVYPLDWASAPDDRGVGLSPPFFDP